VLKLLEVGHARQHSPEVSVVPSAIISLPAISLHVALAWTLGFCFVVFGSFVADAQSISGPGGSDQNSTQPQDAAMQAYHAGISLVRQGHLDEAIQTFKTGLETDPQNLVLMDAIGAAYNLKGDLEPAKKYFLDALQADPGFIPARKNLAITYFNLGQYDLAEPEFRRLMDGPGDSRSIACLFLGIIAEKHQEYDKSVALFEKSADLSHQYPQALISFANSLYNLHRLQKAEAVLNHLDAMSGVSAAEYFAAGQLYSKIGQDNRALADYDRAGQNETELDGLDYQRAVVLDRMGRSQEALKILKDLTAAKPDADSLNLLAHVADENREFDVALQSLRQAAKLDPEREDSYLDFSTLCANYENYTLALQAADAGLTHLPNSYRLQVQKGVMLEKLGRLDEAQEILRSASRLQKDNSVAELSLAIVQADASEWKNAESTLTAAIRDFPTNYYMHYELGKVLVQIQESAPADPEIKARAKHAFREAIRCNPSFADSYYQLSKLYLRGAPKLAEQNLVTCLRLDPNHAPAEYALARLYINSGRRGEGQALIDRFEGQQQAEKLKEKQRPRIEATQK
jgi:tetratricopeptide (TPR) repeat protein